MLRTSLKTTATLIYAPPDAGALLTATLRNPTASGCAALLEVRNKDAGTFYPWPGGTVPGYGGARGPVVLNPGDELWGSADVLSTVHIELTAGLLQDDWTTFESPNAQDPMAMGEISFFNYAAPTNIAIAAAADPDAMTNMVLANVATTLTSGGVGVDMPSNGRIRVTATGTFMVHAAFSMSILPAGANDTAIVATAKNGTVQSNARAPQKLTALTDYQSFAWHWFGEMTTNDYLEAYIGNVTDADDLGVSHLNIVIVGMRAI